MIIRFIPHQTTTLPKWMFCQKLFFKSTLLLIGYCGIHVCMSAPTSSDDLCLLFCIYPSSHGWSMQMQRYISGFWATYMKTTPDIYHCIRSSRDTLGFMRLSIKKNIRLIWNYKIEWIFYTIFVTCQCYKIT